MEAEMTRKEVETEWGEGAKKGQTFVGGGQAPLGLAEWRR